MAWQTPKTNWGQPGQTVPGVDDFNRIEGNIETLGRYDRAPGYGTATGTNAKTITLDPAPTSYYDGLCFAFKNATQNTGAVTINVNGLGARPIKKPNGNDVAAGNLKAGSIYTVRYNGTNFILQGSDSSGNATPEHVLAGKTFSNDNDTGITGTMPNRGAINHTITTQNGQYTIPEGYHDGNGKVTANFANLEADNIRYPINVGGVIGTYGKAQSVASPDTNNRWLTVSAYRDLSEGEERVIGRFKPNVAGNITVGVTTYQGTTGATGTFYIRFYKNGVLTGSTSQYMDTTEYKTVYKDISNVSPNNTVEIRARYSGGSSAASTDRYSVHFSIEGIAPPIAL